MVKPRVVDFFLGGAGFTNEGEKIAGGSKPARPSADIGGSEAKGRVLEQDRLLRARFLGFFNLRGGLEMEPNRESDLASGPVLVLWWKGPGYEDDAGVSGEVPGVSMLDWGPSKEPVEVGDVVVEEVDVLVRWR